MPTDVALMKIIRRCMDKLLPLFEYIGLYRITSTGENNPKYHAYKNEFYRIQALLDREIIDTPYVTKGPVMWENIIKVHVFISYGHLNTFSVFSEPIAHNKIKFSEKNMMIFRALNDQRLLPTCLGLYKEFDSIIEACLKTYADGVLECY